MHVKTVILTFSIFLMLSTDLYSAPCLKVTWDVPAEVVPGQSMRIKVRLANKCKYLIRIEGFEARIVRVKLLNLLDIPLDTKVMGVSYKEERIILPDRALSLTSARVEVPWYTPPGVYVFKLLVRTNRGVVTSSLGMRVMLTKEHELALYLLALLALGVLMLSLPYGKGMRVRVRKRIDRG